MAAVHKKPASTETQKRAETQSEKKIDAKKVAEPVEVLDVVTEITERVEVVEEVTPAEAPSAASPDPLTDFKEKMSEEEEQPVLSPPSQKNFMWPILFVVFLALAFLIGIFVYKQGLNKSPGINVVTLTPTPTIMPEPTKAVDLTRYEIQVLNGSEVDGEAGRQRDSLGGEGFVVASVGNADSSDYKETIIQAKADVDQAYLDKLKSVLEESFAVGETEELPQDADSDVIVIIGSETK